MKQRIGVPLSVFWLMACTLALGALHAEDKPWIELTSSPTARMAWQRLEDDWLVAQEVGLDPANPRKLTGMPGEGILVNSPKQRARDLITKQRFGDVEVHVEFMISRGSNSGVKLMGLYEIQILDSFGKENVTGNDCGGVYPRAEERPVYRQIDKGVPPRVNACLKPGEWQTLDITFSAPRFDSAGKKTANARFVRVVLNGQLIHENQEVEYPTGAAWSRRAETATGPLLLQGDHGPVAFRNVRVRPIEPSSSN